MINLKLVEKNIDVKMPKEISETAKAMKNGNN